MLRKYSVLTLSALLFLLSTSCTSTQKTEGKQMNDQNGSASARRKYTLMTLDPGHFHAALVQKEMNDEVSPTVYVYAPDGFDLNEHLKRIEGFNTRPANPTRWEEKVYRGNDYLEKMIAEKPGNVVVIAGNNRKKTEYIKSSVDAGLNVLADKPMCTDEKGWELLKEAFKSAGQKGVLLYDIMTERYEITTVLQKALANNPEVFGQLQPGTPDNPSVTKESVHHIFKYVDRRPLVRPAWYFDTTQQGEGIVDVTTHLVDLVFWECFPDQKVATEDISLLKAKRWPTVVTKEQFSQASGLPDFPDFLKAGLDPKGALQLFANGEMTFKVKGVHAKTSVTWNYQAPEGAGDTHFSVMKGTKAVVTIRQGKEENYKPELYVTPTVPAQKAAVEAELKKAVDQLQSKFAGIALKPTSDGWQVTVPDKFRDGHESHFSQVAARYLKFLDEKKMPDWEVPNMITKYYVTTQALKLAQKQGGQGGKTD
ncbi:MAG TPA: putative oxidoreductase C-terminal domain-containing protein [Blastocatellia bacterium]|nr:putative oxidoreductase C-terminal domain-containing protein [Blastocatellia bacterium]